MVQDQEDTRRVHSAQVLQQGEAMGCWIFHNWSNPPDRYGCTARVTCLDCGKVTSGLTMTCAERTIS